MGVGERPDYEIPMAADVLGIPDFGKYDINRYKIYLPGICIVKKCDL